MDSGGKSPLWNTAYRMTCVQGLHPHNAFIAVIPSGDVRKLRVRGGKELVPVIQVVTE